MLKVKNNHHSRDRKTQQALHRQQLRQKSAKQRNKLNHLLHNFTPGFLQPQFQGDQTIKVSQNQIKNNVNIQTASYGFDLDLQMGSYKCGYSRNGSHLLLTSDKGHVAILNWRQKQLQMQINLNQTILDYTFMHNHQMFALSQKQNTFIYDGKGTQIHKLPFSQRTTYLPYHYLLVAQGQRKIKYIDITTGHIVADHMAKNMYSSMTQNPGNGVIAVGTQRGVVEWWTPGIGTPQIQLFVGSKVDDICFHKGYMYTAAHSLKVWDTRTLKLLHQKPINRRIINMNVSGSGLLAINYGFQVQFYKDLHLQNQKIPYLRNKATKGNFNNLQFVPHEDVMGLGTRKGFNSIIVPGSGVPYYDSFQNNPFQTKKQMRQSQVHKLLQKLAPQTITIDPNVLGGMNRLTKQQMQLQQKAQKQRKQKQHLQKIAAKKSKGKSKKINKRQIQMDKFKRNELTKVINSKMWAKRAQRKKRQGQLALIQQMQGQGLSVSDLVKNNKTTKKIEQNQQQ